jgi:hypothetical protein
MFPEISPAAKCALAAGYLLATVGQRILRFRDAMNAPHFPLFGTITALFALLALVVAFGLVRQRRWALVLARVYFWFVLVVFLIFSPLMLFGVVHPEDYDTSITASVLSIVFAAFFLRVLRRVEYVDQKT